MSVCLLLASICDTAHGANKMLLMNPARIVFTEKQRSINAHVANLSNEAITYEISLVTMRKDKNGKFTAVRPEAETETEKLAKSLIRFSPRRATIEPGKRQVVKLMTQKPANLPQGEYQTRLSLIPLPDPVSTSMSKTEGKSEINLDLIVTSSFPVVIQNGVSAEVTPISYTLKENQKAPAGLAAEVKLARSGNASAFGNAYVMHIPAKDQQAGRVIGMLSDIAVYLPETERTVTVPLTNVSRQDLSSGTVRVEFDNNAGLGTGSRGQKGNISFKDFSGR